MSARPHQPRYRRHVLLLCTALAIAVPYEAEARQRAVIEVVETGRIGNDPVGIAFTGFNAAVLLPDGSIVVPQPNESRIVRVRPDLRGADDVARAGGGPGELSRLSYIGAIGDTIWALDQHHRIIRYPPGAPAATVSCPVPTTSTQFLPVAVLAGGATLLGSPRGLGEERQRVAIGRDDCADPVEIADFESRNAALQLISGGARMSVPQPFSDADIFVIDAGGQRFAIINRTVSPRPGAYRVRMFDHTGRQVFAYDGSVTAVPLSERRRRAAVQQLQNIFAVRPPQFRDLPALPPLRAADVERELFRPTHLPAIRSAMLDRQGRLWLELWGDGDATADWLVLAADGAPLGTATLPRDMQLLDGRGTTLVGREYDADGVAQLIVLRVGL